MVKSWVFGSLGAGVGLIATAVYVQTHPLAFTEATTTHLDVSAAVAAPDVALQVMEPSTEPIPNVIELSPVLIAPERPRVAPRATPKPEPELAPCSDWREIGPAHVEDGVGLDARRVRELC